MTELTAKATDRAVAFAVRPTAPAVLARIRAELPAIQRRSGELDREGGFPTEDIGFLRTCGALELFGAGGSTPRELMEALRLVGRGSLSVGRIFEGHVNGAGLVAWYGDDRQLGQLTCRLDAGEIFGVWNTEKPPGVWLEEHGGGARSLIGQKTFATGGGHIDHAIVTASLPDGRKQMVIADAHDTARADASGWRVRGMRATLSGVYDLTGVPADAVAILGEPGDYEREPRFSAGAWRFTAVQLGGVERIIGLLRDHLAGSPAGGGDPVHRARFGQALAAGALGLSVGARSGRAGRVRPTPALRRSPLS